MTTQDPGDRSAPAVGAPAPPTPAVFWIAIATFALADLANAMRREVFSLVSRWIDPDLFTKVLTFLLLAAFALAAAYVLAVVLAAVRARRRPAGGDLLRAAVAAALLLGHLALLALAVRRGG